MSDSSKSVYVANRVRELAQQAANALPLARLNTAETFALVRKHGIKPETAAQFNQRVRKAAQLTKTRIVASLIPFPHVQGNLAAYNDEYNSLYQERVNAREETQKLLMKTADEIADHVVAVGATDNAIENIQQFIAANT